MKKKQAVDFLSVFLLTILLGGPLYAQDKAGPAPVEVKKEGSGENDDKLKKVDEKKYTEEEFKKELKIKISEKMEQIKKGDISEISFEVLAKEKELNEREKILKLKEEEIKTSAEELIKQTKKLNESQEKLLGCLSTNEKKSNDRMNHVVSILSDMRPQKASELLSVQDPEIAIKILSQLDTVKASKIFNMMDKEISARIQKQYLDMKK